MYCAFINRPVGTPDKKGNTMAEINETAAQPTNTEPAENTRTFTQDEVSTLCAREAGKAERAILKQLGLSDKSGLADLVERMQRATNTDTALTAVTGERDNYKTKYEAALSELTTLKNTTELAKYGVTDADDAEYYSFKIGKMVDKNKDFATAAKEYFSEHPFNSARVSVVSENKGGGNISNLNDMINKKLRGEI